MTLTITEADRHPGMYAISDSALLPVEEQVFFSGYFGKHGPWVYVAGPQLLEALEAVTSSCTSSAAPMSEGQTRIVTAPSRDSLVKARAAIALAKGPKT